MLKWIVLTVLPTIVVILLGTIMFAHHPIIEKRPSSSTLTVVGADTYTSAMLIGDPTFSAYRVYGQISQAHEIDMYAFVPDENATIEFEVLSPIQLISSSSSPTVTIIGEQIGTKTSLDPPFPTPLGFESFTFTGDFRARRGVSFVPFGLQFVYTGVTQEIDLSADTQYFIAVYDETGETGPYILRVGQLRNMSRSIRSTFTPVNPDDIVFSTSLLRKTKHEDIDDFEELFAIERNNPFEAVNTVFELVYDYIDFYLYRLGTVF